MKRPCLGALAITLASCRDGAPAAPAPLQNAPRAAVATVNDASGGSDASTRVEVKFPSAGRTLTGILWLPKGDGPHRGVIFNHGSERDPGDGATLARFYNARGFVLFVPWRRGHGTSEGKYFGDARESVPAGSARQQFVIDELVAQSDDVVAAYDYLATRKEVRKDAVAVTGCSFGGIEVMLVAERTTGFKAAVDFAGGAMSWKQSPALRDRLVQAASKSTLPVFFIQAENDFDLDPTKVLSAEMERAHKPNQSKIYPARGSSPQEGHGLCRTADAWGDDVVRWLDGVMP